MLQESHHTSRTEESHLVASYGSFNVEEQSGGTGELLDEEQTHDVTLPSIWRRMPNTAFGICLGLAGQANMWKTVDNSHILMPNSYRADTAVEFFWFSALVCVVVVSAAYVYKAFTHFEYIQDEYLNPGRIHFMNAPHLVMILLALGVPESVATTSTENGRIVIWTVGLCAQLILTQFVYEKWFFSKRSNIALAAQPTFLLSTVGWFLLAVLGQQVQIAEKWGIPFPAFCLGAGTMFYTLVVISIIHRLYLSPENKGSPALTLFIAPPSVGVVALNGFGGSVIAEAWLGWCLVLFLLLIKLSPKIAARPPTLGSYWAYVFPLSALASAIINTLDASDASCGAKALGYIFVGVATLATVVVFVRTVVECYATLSRGRVWGDPLVVERLLRERASADAEVRMRQPDLDPVVPANVP